MAAYETVTHDNWFSRLGKSIKGVLFGLLLFVVSFVVLFVNEGMSFRRGSVLAEVSKIAVTVDSKSVDPGNDHKVVHFTGDASGETLIDKDFNVTQTAIHLQRKVEMYQWKEVEHKESKKNAVGGGETTTTWYTYEKVWSDKPIKSAEFTGTDRDTGVRGSVGFTNPAVFPVTGQTLDANVVMVGAFKLPHDLIEKINNYQNVPATDSMASGMSDEWKDKAVVRQGLVYLRGDDRKPDPSGPQVGDVKVSFRAVPPGPVSVMAQQAGSTLEPYHAKDGDFAELHTGIESKETMIKAEQGKNAMQTWILRLVGFIVMWVGLAVALSPLKVLADVIGIVGDIVGMGIALMTGLIALALSVLTIGVAWLFYRPLIGVPLVLVGVAGIVLFVWMRRQGRAKRMAAGPGAFGGGPPMPGGPGLPPVPRM